MPPRQAKNLRFPQGRDAIGLVLDNDDYKLLAGAIGPCHGGDIEDFLAAAPVVTGGRFIATDHPLSEEVLAAVGVEVRGYMKVDYERDEVLRVIPRRGSTAERLLVLYVMFERHML